MKRAVLLHNIRSAYNVGSIFRTADGAGVSHVYLSGYTPQPLDRFGRPQKELAKTALGAEQSIPWTYAETPDDMVAQWKQKGGVVVGVEQDERAIDYRTFSPKQDTLFVLGTEVGGMDHTLLDMCDTILEIPMHGEKDSLNVSVAAGIVLFSIAS